VALAYLLDTNIVSHMIDNPHEPANRASVMIARRGIERVAINIVVAGELHAGIEKRRSDRLRRSVLAVLDSLTVLDLERPVEVSYARIRADLERRGLSIGTNDLWIAAHALTLDLTVVTANVSEFSRVEGLRVENWLVA